MKMFTVDILYFMVLAMEYIKYNEIMLDIKEGNNIKSGYFG